MKAVLLRYDALISRYCHCPSCLPAARKEVDSFHFSSEISESNLSSNGLITFVDVVLCVFVAVAVVFSEILSPPLVFLSMWTKLRLVSGWKISFQKDWGGIGTAA